MGGSRGWYVVSNWFLKQVARVLDSVVGVPQYKHGLLTSMHTFSSTKKTQSSFEEDNDKESNTFSLNCDSY